jgi:acyl-lipid omega-6 desaturase (Delta-12 desaturase)
MPAFSRLTLTVINSYPKRSNTATKPSNHGAGDRVQHQVVQGEGGNLRLHVQELYAHCRNYGTAQNSKAIWQLLSTALPFFALLLAIAWLAPLHYGWALLLAMPAGILLTRLFALQHDCGHGSFFSSRKANEALGQLLSLLTFTPYDHWRRSHAIHHAGSGNLERRGIGDVETLTVREYREMTLRQQWRYRITRHPFVALLIGPPLYFLVLQRLPRMSALQNSDSTRAIHLHNIALIVFYGALFYLFGILTVVAVMLPVAVIAAWIGGWLFFVQHQFEETLWEGADEWDVKLAALKSSSHLVLHPVLNWFTCDIGLHHIHHLSSRIPNYRLRECMAAHKGLQEIAPKLTFTRAMASMHLGLWDEASRKLISFGEFKRLPQAA